MTVSEAKGNCDGGSFTSHRGQLGKSTRSEESQIEKKNDDVDELSEDVSQICLSESKCDSAVESEIQEKLGELTINSAHPPQHGDDEAKDENSVENLEDHVQVKVVISQLNITENREDINSRSGKELQDEKKAAQKSTILDLNIVKEDAKISGEDEKDKDEDENAKKDGELCPRSPMRPEHGNMRCEPYQGTSRSRHHSSGGFCVADFTTNNNSIIQNNWTANLNIHHQQFTLDASYPSPPPYPFSYATSPAEDTDEGVYDVLSPEAFCNASKYDEFPEVCQDDIAEVLGLLDKRGIDLNKLAQPDWDTSFHPNADEICSMIPLPVAEWSDHIFPECIARTITADSSPLSVSSGYNSACSPRSTNSTPSPSSSLKGSQETINVGFMDQMYTNIGSVGGDTISSIQASPSYDYSTDYSSVPTNYQTPTFSQSPMGNDVPNDDSLSNSIQFSWGLPTTFVAPKPKRLEPKPTFSLGSGKERLAKKLDKAKKSKTWAHISTIADQDLAAGDSDGDTQLMILLLKEPIKGDCKLEMIYALVDRLKKIPNALTAVNRQGQSALYLSALHCPDMDADLITRYIADTLLSIGATLDTSVEGGDTLLHCLCRQGAKRFNVLRELLTLNNTHQCFQLNKFNNEGLTPLHVAVCSHQGKQLDCINMVRLLINAGVNATVLTKNEANYSALHLGIIGSCDPNLVSALLTSSSVAATCGDAPYRQDTALHMVARRNDLPLSQQSKVYAELVAKGAHKDARDSKGKLPLDLVAPDRKEAIKQMIHQKW